MPGFLNPSEIVKKLPIMPGMNIADFGAGSGFFSIAFAKALNNKGRVFSLDIWEKALEALRIRARIEKVFPMIETQVADLGRINGSKLKPESINLVLISNILFQMQEKKNIIKEANRVLDKDGLLVIIDWNSSDLPNKEMHYSLEKPEMKKLVLDSGFKFKEEIYVSDTHYCLIFTKI